MKSHGNSVKIPKNPGNSRGILGIPGKRRRSQFEARKFWRLPDPSIQPKGRRSGGGEAAKTQGKSTFLRGCLWEARRNALDSGHTPSTPRSAGRRQIHRRSLNNFQPSKMPHPQKSSKAFDFPYVVRLGNFLKIFMNIV